MMTDEKSQLLLYMQYADKNIWSQRYPRWKRYHVKKPRLPKEADSEQRWVDATTSKPNGMTMMIGTHNDEILSSFRGMREVFEDTRALPASVVVYGPSGSGKTTIVELFAQELLEELDLPSHRTGRFFLNLNATDFPAFTTLWAKVLAFIEPPIEKVIDIPFRLVIIDNLDVIPPSHQHKLKKMMEFYSAKTRWILICGDNKKLITYVQRNSLALQTRPISEKDALTVSLGLLYRNKIGYERDGVKAVFDVNKHPISLSKIMDSLQKVFLDYSYISRENVAKAAGGEPELPEMEATAAIMPLSRCQICTLPPPCAHITEEQIAQMGMNRRKLLPRHKKSTECPEFMKYGVCSLYNAHGRCVLDHPKDAHRVIMPAKRCSQCSIPWPCQHCDYSSSRNELISTIANVRERISVLKQLNVPEPLPVMIRNLENTFCDWKDVIAEWGLEFLTAVKDELLQQTDQWVNSVYTVVKEDYRAKERFLRSGFEELLFTDLLDINYLRSRRDSDFDTDSDDDEDEDDDDGNEMKPPQEVEDEYNFADEEENKEKKDADANVDAKTARSGVSQRSGAASNRGGSNANTGRKGEATDRSGASQGGSKKSPSKKKVGGKLPKKLGAIAALGKNDEGEEKEKTEKKLKPVPRLKRNKAGPGSLSSSKTGKVSQLGWKTNRSTQSAAKNTARSGISSIATK